MCVEYPLYSNILTFVRIVSGVHILWCCRRLLSLSLIRFALHSYMHLNAKLCRFLSCHISMRCWCECARAYVCRFSFFRRSIAPSQHVSFFFFEKKHSFFYSLFRLSFVFIFSGKFYAFFTSTCMRLCLCAFEFNDINNRNRIRLMCTNKRVSLSLSQVSFTESRLTFLHLIPSLSMLLCSSVLPE